MNTDVNSRADISHIMEQFRSLLGMKWDKYRHVLTHFLTGRLTRSELQEELDTLLNRDQTLVRLHNRFLLANLANALQDAPGSGSAYSGWGSRPKDDPYAVQADGQFAKLKDDIMSLSVRERKRIKQIAKEQSKVEPIPSAIIATRRALLPKIPLVNIPTSTQATPGATTDKDGKDAKAVKKQEKEKHPQPPTEISAVEAEAIIKSKSTQTLAQDIVQAYEAPLSTDTYELPDAEALGIRMLGVALENGLVNGIDAISAEVMLAALEYYLKGLVQTAFDTVKRRRARANTSGDANGMSVLQTRGPNGSTSQRVNQIHDPEDIITVDDIARIVESSPNYLVELSGPFFRMNDTMRMDDDEWAKLSGQAFNVENHGLLEETESGVFGIAADEDTQMVDINQSSRVKLKSLGMGVSTSQANLVAAVASTSGPQGDIDMLLDAIFADGVSNVS